MIHRQSDPFIVVGDPGGPGINMAKGRAGRLPGQSTHGTRKDCLFPRIMSRSLLKLLLRDRPEEPGVGTERKRHLAKPHVPTYRDEGARRQRRVLP